MTAGTKLWRNRNERKDWARRLRSEDPGLEVVHPHAAGIDVGNSAHCHLPAQSVLESSRGEVPGVGPIAPNTVVENGRFLL